MLTSISRGDINKPNSRKEIRYPWESPKCSWNWVKHKFIFKWMYLYRKDGIWLGPCKMMVQLWYLHCFLGHHYLVKCSLRRLICPSVCSLNVERVLLWPLLPRNPFKLYTLHFNKTQFPNFFNKFWVSLTLSLYVKNKRKNHT